MPGPIVGIAVTHDGAGYWLVDSSGGVHPFGDATALSGPALPPGDTIEAVAGTPDGGGYWLLDAAGHVFPYGDAVQYPFTG